MQESQVRVRVRAVKRQVDGDRFTEQAEFEERSGNEGAPFYVQRFEVLVRSPTSEPLFHVGREFVVTIAKA